MASPPPQLGQVPGHCAAARRYRRRATGSIVHGVDNPHATEPYGACRMPGTDRFGRSCENRSVHIGRPIMRGFRALVFAVACTLVSAGLHFVAGGALISWGVFAAAVAALAPIGFLLGGAQRTWTVLLPACAVAQAGLHVWFTASSGHLEHLVPGPVMLLVHVLAMTVSAVWLARGDAALAAFLDLLVLWSAASLLLRLCRTAPAARLVRACAERVLAPPVLRLLCDTAARRGPPAFAFSH